MMTGRRHPVGRCSRWRWWQGSAIAWRLGMMMSMRGRGRRTGVRCLGNAAGPWTTSLIHLFPGAGPAWRAWTGPLNLSSSAVMSLSMVFGGVLASVGPVSSLPIPTPQSVAFRPVRAGPSHHRDAWSHGLWFKGPRRPGGRFLHLLCPQPRTSGSLGPFRLGLPVAAWKGVEEPLQEHGFWRNCPWSHVLGISTPQPWPCVVSPVHWPWLVLAKPQAANLYRRCMASLLYIRSALRSVDIAGSESVCRFFWESACTPGTLAEIQRKTTGHVIAHLPSCSHRYGLTQRWK